MIDDHGHLILTREAMLNYPGATDEDRAFIASMTPDQARLCMEAARDAAIEKIAEIRARRDRPATGHASPAATLDAYARLLNSKA